MNYKADEPQDHRVVALFHTSTQWAAIIVMVRRLSRILALQDRVLYEKLNSFEHI